MKELRYLQIADELGYHLSDFFVAEDEFAERFAFKHLRPLLLNVAFNAGGFENWEQGFSNILNQESKGLIGQIEAQIDLAQVIYDVPNPEEVFLFIGNNDYVDMAFDRLRGYVELENIYLEYYGDKNER